MTLYELVKLAHDNKLINDEQLLELVEELDEIVKNETELSALKYAGVDNWEGYDVAMNMIDEWDKENE